MMPTEEQEGQEQDAASWTGWASLKEDIKQQPSETRTYGELQREVHLLESSLKDLKAQLETSAAKVAGLETEAVKIERAGQEALETVHRELARTKEAVVEGEKKIAAMAEESAAKLRASAADPGDARGELVLEKEQSGEGATPAQARAELELELERTRSELILAREKAEAERYVFSAKSRARQRRMAALEAELEAARQAAEQATAQAEEERCLHAALLRRIKGLEDRTVSTALTSAAGKLEASGGHDEASGGHVEAGTHEVHAHSHLDAPAQDERALPPRDPNGRDQEAPADQSTQGGSVESEPSVSEPEVPKEKSRQTYRVCYDDGEQPVVDTFLAFFGEHFGEPIVHDRENLSVSISVTPEAKACVACEMLARYLEHAIRVSREEYVQPSDFILMRIRVACSGEAASGPYVLPAGQHGIASATMVTTLRDEFGVMMDRVPSWALDARVLSSDSGDFGGDGNSTWLEQGAWRKMELPEYHGAPPLPEMPEGLAKRHRVFQIWGLSTAVWAVYLQVGGSREMNMAGSLELWAKPADVRNVTSKLHRVLGVSVSCEERDSDRSVAVLAGRHAGALEEVYLRAVNDLSAALPYAIQHVDMEHVGAMRQFATRAAAQQANAEAGRGGGEGADVRLLFLWRAKKVVVLLLSGPSREKERLRTMKRACEFLWDGKMRWIDRNVNLRVTAKFVNTAKARPRPRTTFPDNAKDIRPGIAVFFSEIAGADLWLDGLKVTGKVAEGVDRTTTQRKLEAEYQQQQQQQQEQQRQQQQQQQQHQQQQQQQSGGS